jgi:hypothetical protein
MPLFAVPLCLALAAPAQVPVPVDVAASAPARADVRIGTSADVPRADGPGFEIAFHPRGPVVQPVYGADAPDAPWLGLELERVARGTRIVATGGPVEPRVLAPLAEDEGPAGVAYDRGAVLELYEPRGAAIEQSFVLAHRPEAPGATGDLVVRLRLTGPLADAPHRVDPDGGLVFARADLADRNGVRIGGVTGVDAAGARITGELRRDGAALELVLPAALVDAARYPLVVDPLIGSPFDVVVIPNDDRARDVAYDSTRQCFLVVFERRFSGSDVRVRALRVTKDGAPTGSTAFLGSSSPYKAEHARVGNAHAVDLFAVVWAEEADSLFGPIDFVRVQTVDAWTGAIGTLKAVASAPAGELLAPDVAGSSATIASGALVVVYKRIGVGLETVRVTVAGSSTPSVSPPTTIAFDPPFATLDAPAISRAAWKQDRFLIVYELAGLVSTDVRAVLVDGSGKIVVGPVSVTATTDRDEVEPEVDGDGKSFVVAWSVPVEPGGTQHEVRVARVRQDGASLVVEASVAPVPPFFLDSHRRPRVAYLPGKALLAVAGFGTPQVVGLDPVTLGVCEDPYPVGEGVDPGDLALASQASGATQGANRALVAYTPSPGIFGTGDVYGQLLDAVGPGGAVVDLGGGCGAGGTASVTSAVAIGNGFLVHLLSGADPGATTAILNFAAGSPAPLTCGPCAWTPFATTIQTSVYGGGFASASTSIPCNTALVGAVLESQWTLVTPGQTPCPSFPGFSLSNRLRLVVGT